MKRAVSISIGSSKRNKATQIKLLGETVQIERIGTDGDVKRAAELYEELDGKVDAFGVGGADLGFMVKRHFYPMYSVLRTVKNVKKTPLADGNGLKCTLEARVKDIITGELSSYIQPKKAFVLAAIDRWGITSSFIEAGYDCIFGDLLFGLGLTFIVHSEKAILNLARILMPVVGQFPFGWLYPTGKEQEKRTPKWEQYFNWAKVIAGDCNYITRYGPDRMDGKVIVTNTTTVDDRTLFKRMGAKYLITTTPILDGRSFGTNMMEAAILAAIGWKKPVDYFHPDEYLKMMEDIVEKIKFLPTVMEL
jgi:hypothetical protein